MKIVIEIDDEVYEGVTGDTTFRDCERTALNAIRNGTVLPEHHGRLLILDEEKVEQEFTDVSFSIQKWISEVELSNATIAILEALALEQKPCEDSIVEWKKDFKGYVNSLSMPRDDYNGIMEYIDELPPVTLESKIVALLEKTYDDFCKCEGGEGWLKIDGKEYSTDVGYAIDGMRIFVEVLKQRLAQSGTKT